jgi:hypothetical protein
MIRSSRRLARVPLRVPRALAALGAIAAAALSACGGDDAAPGPTGTTTTTAGTTTITTGTTTGTGTTSTSGGGGAGGAGGSGGSGGGTDGCDVAYPDRTVGLRVCKPGASSGYLLYPVKHRGDVYLLDRLGRAVHHWSKSTYEPGQSCYLRPNGNLVRAAMKKGNSIGGGEGGRIEEYDWDDNLVWSFDFATDAGTTHHDFKILPSGNLLMLAVERKSADDAAAVGFDKAELHDGYVAPELVVEIARKGDSFEVVWEWHVWDHLVQGKNKALANYGDPAATPGRLEVAGGAPAFWNHANSIDYSPELDQIVISARSHDEAWVIDHGTTTAEAKTGAGGKRGKGGDFIYRWGNPSTYHAGTAADRMLFNQHDVQWIAPGLPGAGHLLVFNNGLDRPQGAYSTLDELETPVLPDGSWPSVTPGVAWGPKALAWQFVGTPPTSFYGEEISGTQRLPNGNTTACEGTTGRFFEVTAAGEIVWEYVNPVANAGPMTQYEVASLDPKGHPESAVFKTHWYPADFPGFAGRDLSTGAPIERSDTACPTANPSYTCKAESDCTAAGGTDKSDRFTCDGGAVCCLKLYQEGQPKP